jgi:hypothetical protein
MPYVTVNDRGPRPSRLLALSAQLGGTRRLSSLDGNMPPAMCGTRAAASGWRA